MHRVSETDCAGLPNHYLPRPLLGSGILHPNLWTRPEPLRSGDRGSRATPHPPL